MMSESIWVVSLTDYEAAMMMSTDCMLLEHVEGMAEIVTQENGLW